MSRRSPPAAQWGQRPRGVARPAGGALPGWRDPSIRRPPGGPMSENSFGARDTLKVSGREFEIFRLDALQSKFDVARLPFSLKVLLENLLRTEGNGSVAGQDIEALASWDANAEPSKEIAFSPARVLMQDFTGVPAVVDLAAMRDAMAEMNGDPAK